MSQSHADDVKYLIKTLEAEPFSKDFNFASFESMSREEILQILTDVIASLTGNTAVKVCQESQEQTTERIFRLLRMLKYRPMIDCPEDIQTGLETGDCKVICSIMVWLLQNKESLSVRAYLANFLVRIEIPPLLIHDAEISELSERHLALMEEFKAIHKTYDKCKKGLNITELMSDMQNIEHDLDCLRRRIEIARSKFGDQQDVKQMLGQARLNRKAREKIHELYQQSHSEEQKLQESEARIRYLKRLLKQLKDKNDSLSGPRILEALEDNCEVLKYIVEEKLPSDIQSNDRTITALTLVDNDPSLTPHDLNSLKAKATIVKSEINNLEARLMHKMHDKGLSKLREEVMQMQRNRMIKAQKLESLRNDLRMRREDLECEMEKRDEAIRNGREIVPSEDQYHKYVKQMRVKASRYKQLRNQLAQLQHEAGILSGTKFIINGEYLQSQANLEEVEAKHGILGYCATQDQLEEFSEKKSMLNENIRTTLYQMSCMSKELNDKLGLKKLDLEPLVKELQRKRLATELLEKDHNRLKDAFQSALTAAQLDNYHHQLKIDQLSSQQAKEALELGKLRHEINLMKADLDRVSEPRTTNEQQLQGKDKTRCFKDKLLVRILEEERRSAQLREERDQIEDQCSLRRNLQDQWSSLRKLLILKMDLISYPFV